MVSITRPLHRISRFAAIALIVALPACSRNQPGEAIDPSAPAIMTFNNESLSQADVFAIAQGSNAMRIGTVMGGRTETLRIPAEVANRGTVRIVARLLASSALPSSGPIAIHPGEHLDVRLPLDQRTLVVLPGS
jgi:hypothetical protein